MATDKRNFLRMNSDDSPLALPVGDTRSMVNCHVWPTYVKGVKGNTLVAEMLFTSTQSYTANCPNGTVGEPVTRSATRTSYESQERANELALSAAQELAEADLVCTPGATPSVVINDVLVNGDTVTINATAVNTPSAIEYSIGAAYQSSNVFSGLPSGDYTATARLTEDVNVFDSHPFKIKAVGNTSLVNNYTDNSGIVEIYSGAYNPQNVIDLRSVAPSESIDYTFQYDQDITQFNIRLSFSPDFTATVNGETLNSEAGVVTFLNKSLPLIISIG